MHINTMQLDINAVLPLVQQLVYHDIFSIFLLPEVLQSDYFYSCFARFNSFFLLFFNSADRHGQLTAIDLQPKLRVHLVQAIHKKSIGKAILLKHAQVANTLLIIAMYGFITLGSGLPLIYLYYLKVQLGILGVIDERG